jgi:hypothetical protein
MKPKPFESLNHLTIPVAIFNSLKKYWLSLALLWHGNAARAGLCLDKENLVYGKSWRRVARLISRFAREPR